MPKITNTPAPKAAEEVPKRGSARKNEQSSTIVPVEPKAAKAAAASKSEQAVSPPQTQVPKRGSGRKNEMSGLPGPHG